MSLNFGMTENKRKMEEDFKFLQDQLKLKTLLQVRVLSGLSDFVTEWEAEQILGVKRTTLYLLRREGKLQTKPVGRKTYYLTNSIVQYVMGENDND